MIYLLIKEDILLNKYQNINLRVRLQGLNKNNNKLMYKIEQLNN